MLEIRKLRLGEVTAAVKVIRLVRGEVAEDNLLHVTVCYL